MKLKFFSLFQWQISRVGLKVFLAICVVAGLFIPFASVISYRHAVYDAQASADAQVERLAKMVHNTAAMAAYLNDKELTNEILTGLKTAPIIASVRLTLSSNEVVAQGPTMTFVDKSFPLNTRFSDAPVGKLEISLNHQLIDDEAFKDGVFLIVWQLFLLVTILLCVLFIFRRFVVSPLRSLMQQVQQVKMGIETSQQTIEISGHDEIAFLANHTNELVQKIHGLYREEAERNLKIAHLERQFRMIFENSHAGIALVNPRNKIFMSNAAFNRLLLDSEAAIPTEQCYLPELFEAPYELEDMLNQVRRNKVSAFKDYCLSRGQDIWVRVLFSLVEDRRGSLSRFIELVVYDISDRAKQEKLFAYNATHDALTGLLNRRGGEARFKEQLALAKRQKSHFVMALIDLNDFKPVNDQHGHDAGDVVLKVISTRLLSVLRADDIVTRWGGDEFVVSFVLDDLSRLTIILDDLQQAFVAAIDISDDLSVRVGASIGVSQSAVEGYELMSLIESADAAMYQVKHQGKGRYFVATEKMSNPTR